MNNYKILHINTVDNQGGASQVAVDLLGNPGTEGHLVVMKKTIDDPRVVELRKTPLDFIFKLFDRILWKLGQRKPIRALLSLDNELNFTYKKLKKLREYMDADIIHLHNLHGGYFDFDTLLKIAKEKKIVWTLHDMWAITGGEAHTFENENYKKGIADTPYISHYPLWNPIIDRRQYFMERKKKIYSKIRDVLTIVPVSEWLNKCVSEAYVYNPGLRLNLIHNGVDAAVFKNKMIRKWERPRVLFFNLTSPFKGCHLLINILDKIKQPFDLYVIGEKLKKNFPHAHYHHIADRRLLSEVYNQSDILVFPSLAENFPLTVLEAMACGVCVIASDVGGIPEMLDNSCGFLFKNNDETSLLNTIEISLKDIQLIREKGKLAEKRVLENFTLEKTSKNYFKLYEEILNVEAREDVQGETWKSKKPLPKISIITPSFNQGKFLEETILSVITQGYENLEFIVIDGDSNDHSTDIIKKFEHRIHHWASEKDSGQSEAINKGFRLATGDIVAWLNSDDLLVKGALHKVASIFLEHASADLIYGDVENFYPDGRKELYSPPLFEIKNFLERVRIHQPSVFWKRELLSRTGLLDENLHYLMDYDLWMRLFFNYKCVKVNETFSQFRIHADSKTSHNPKGLYLEYRKVLSGFFNSLSQDEFIKKLKALGIYDNVENKKYALKNLPTHAEIPELLEMYIQQCAVQEYSYRNIKFANKLFISSLNARNFFHTLGFLIKNNLRVRSISSLFR